jgi:hypothetical protein
MQLREQIRYKVVQRLDEIERLVKQQIHLTNPERVVDLLSEVDKFFTVLTEDEKDFIGAVSFATRTKTRWD